MRRELWAVDACVVGVWEVIVLLTLLETISVVDLVSALSVVLVGCFVVTVLGKEVVLGEVVGFSVVV